MPTDLPKAVTTDAAPAPIGPYNQAIAWDRLVFCSGQVALGPEGGDLLGGGSVVEEAKVVLRNLTAVLEAAGCTPQDVVKTTIYMADMADFAAVNEVYGETFGAGTAPARATVAVAGLPKGARVEIDCIAVRR